MESALSTDASAGVEVKTPLYDRHVAAGAKIIPFAGWLMPVQFNGIIEEHRTVRNGVGMFDLGHMGQVDIRGRHALEYLQYLTSNDVSTLEPGQAHYSLLLNEQGGVVDDIIIYRRISGPGYMVCINAANRHKDISWMHRWRTERPDLDVTVEDISDRTGMIAIQGPRAADVTQRITDRDLSQVEYFTWVEATIGGVPCHAARTGYTGEDGFEFYTAIEHIGALWDALMTAGSADGIAPIGLGARDTLRLEARMSLYGNELADDISPLEAGVGWAVKLDKGAFIGSDKIAAMKTSGPPRRTVGFKMAERSGSPRSHFEVRLNGEAVGYVTSGAMSPTLNENIGLALIAQDVAGIGKPLEIMIRDKSFAAVQVKTPFYKRDR